MDAGARGARAGSCVRGYGTTVLNLSTDPSHDQACTWVASKGQLLTNYVCAWHNSLRSPLHCQKASDVRVFGRQVKL